MWVRKTPPELHREQEARKHKFETVAFVALAAICTYLYWYVGSFENFLGTFRLDGEFALTFLLYPLIVCLGYRSYVLHGSFFIDRPGKICLACGKGMGYSDDGWGFKAYGRPKPKWYQVSACSTPDRCDIAYQFQVKWVNAEAPCRGGETADQ